MIVSLLTLGLLLIPSSNAFFRLPCAKPVLDARVDPIVSPNKASSHAHTIMGSNAIGLSTTSNDLRNSKCTTCKVKDDKSAYWVPELYYQYKNGSFQVVTHGGMIVYYLQRNADDETVETFPDGLRMLVGNPYLRSDPVGTPESKAITWKCIDFNGPDQPETSGFGNTNCPNGLRAQLFFPACWDGVNLDSADHKSHMAFPDGVNGGRCPKTHPHHLVSIFFEVWFEVAQFNKLNDGGRLVLSNGDSTGFALHGDFFNGWDRDVLSRAVKTCTANSGVIEDCPVFQNEGRFASDADMNSCAAPNPFPDEQVAPPNSLLPNLPGCVKVTDGPAPATAADLVPGCVPGNGSPVPVLNPPQNTTTSSTLDKPSPSPVPVPEPSSSSTTPAPPSVTSPASGSEPPVKSPVSGNDPHGNGSPSPIPSPSPSPASGNPASKDPGAVSPTPDPKPKPTTTTTSTTKPSDVPPKDPHQPHPSSSKSSKKPKPSVHHHHRPQSQGQQDDSSEDMNYCGGPPPATDTRKNASVPMRRRHHARRAGHGTHMRF